MLVDCHAHLDSEKFTNISVVLEASVKAGVKRIMNNGLNPKSNKRTLELSKHKIIDAALGIHPTMIPEFSMKELDEEIIFIEKNIKKIKAVGETGLDLHWIENTDNETIKKMKSVFEKLVKISLKYNKPVIVHSRKAECETIEILEKLNVRKVVMHSFTGKKKLLKRIIKNKWFVSIPCTVVKSTQLQEFIRLIPLKQLLTETDCPWQSPFPGKNNEPRFVYESIKKISEIKEIDEEELKKIIFANYIRLFD